MTDEQAPSNTKNKADKTKKSVKQLPEKQQLKPTEAKSKKGSGSGVSWLAIFLVLALAAGGYYFYRQLQQQINSLSTSLNASQQASSNQQQQKTEQLSSGITSLETKLDSVEKASSNGISILQKQVGKSRNQWLIAEAEYLVSIANTRLQLAGDTHTAIVAFQAADQRLKDNGNPITFPIRAQIAKDIMALQSTQLPDIVGISSKLLALESAVTKMKISEPHAGTAQAPEIGKGDPSVLPNNIKETLSDAWANFSKLVVVRRSDEPKAALMTPEQVELIRKNLALKLESARLALINSDQELYAKSLAIVADWLNDYFDMNNAPVSAAIAQINRLIDIPIKASLPDVSQSLKMLRDLPLSSIDTKPESNALAEETTAIVPSKTPEIGNENTETADNTPAEPAQPKPDTPVETPSSDSKVAPQKNQ
ncbi:MAG: hypothetical protein COB62_04900 [Piscirickettsiaceae bacterium]|nr:MAG: hypothetical protein COB62_04900 [Piscirickettsiaceae bacterium]